MSAVVASAAIFAALLTVVLDARLAPLRGLLVGLSAARRRQVAAAAAPGAIPKDPAVIAASVTSVRDLAQQSARRRCRLMLVALLGILYAGWLLRDPYTRGPAIVLLAAEVSVLANIGWRMTRRDRVRHR